MSANAVTIRELRTDFRSVKRKIEEHGEVTVTDRGEPAYVIKSLPKPAQKTSLSVDYYARLLESQPKPMSPDEADRFWEEDRG